VHHPAVDEGDAGEEDHTDRGGRPAQRRRPGAGHAAAGEEHQEAAQDAQDEAGGNDDVDGRPPGGAFQHGGFLLEPAGWRWMEHEPDGDQHTRYRQDVTAGLGRSRFTKRMLRRFSRIHCDFSELSSQQEENANDNSKHR
jgi:hypothetical protein